MSKRKTELQKNWQNLYEPKAKKKVKMAEKTFPITAERANLKNSLTLSTKENRFVGGEEEEEEEEEGREWDGYPITSMDYQANLI